MVHKPSLGKGEDTMSRFALCLMACVLALLGVAQEAGAGHGEARFYVRTTGDSVGAWAPKFHVFWTDPGQTEIWAYAKFARTLTNGWTIEPAFGATFLRQGENTVAPSFRFYNSRFYADLEWFPPWGRIGTFYYYLEYSVPVWRWVRLGAETEEMHPLDAPLKEAFWSGGPQLRFEFKRLAFTVSFLTTSSRTAPGRREREFVHRLYADISL